MTTLKEDYRELNGRTFRQEQLLNALRPIRLKQWLFPEFDVEDMAKEALADGWITSNRDGTFTFTVPDEQAV